MRFIASVLICVCSIVGCKTPGTALTDASVSDVSRARKTPDAEFSRDPFARSDSAVSLADHAELDGGESKIVQVSTLPAADTSLCNIVGACVIATVNGAPIFAADVLAPYKKKLESVREQLPPAEYRKLVRSLLQRDLKTHIDRQILVESLRATLDEEQLKEMDEQLDRMFDDEVKRLEDEYKVNTRVELAKKLEEQGTSLAAHKLEVSKQAMAMRYMQTKAQTAQRVSRSELLAYYHQHEDKFSRKGRVKWQQIEISKSKQGGKEKAIESLNMAISKLNAGARFADVARQYSDGPTASEGGVWDWTELGAFANSEIEKVLFEIPVGTLSDVIEDDGSYHIVLALQRDDPGLIPFTEVQDDIKKLLHRQAEVQLTKKVLEQLRATALVETVFDSDTAVN